MFYYSGNQSGKYGITDSVDNITEYYTEDELYSILQKIGFTSIKGIVYTGSKLKFRETTPVIETLSTLQKGTKFKIRFDGVMHDYTMLGVTALDDGWFVMYKGVQTTIKKKSLLRDKDMIDIEV